jgi:two-component system C4-dicarboxylate transport response regulator DctD
LKVSPAVNFLQAKRNIRASFSGVVLSDIRMPDKDGFDVLHLAQSVDEELPVILLTGEADVPTALRAMREGAYDFLEKPCTTETLLEVIKRALDHRKVVLKARKMERQLRRNDAAALNFPGTSQAVRTLRSALRQTSESNRHIHLVGPKGAGKRLAAYTVHKLAQEMRAFVAISLASEDADLITTALPSNAVDLSLKNIDLADPQHQAWLLAQTGDVNRLRVISSSRLTFDAVARQQGFSEELSNALNPIEIEVPPLSQRRVDLPVLFEELVRQSVRNQNGDMPTIPQSLLSEVMTRDWPGNVAELRNFAKSFVLGTSRDVDTQKALTLADQMDAFERTVLRETLKRTKGSASEAAHQLGLPRKTLYDRLARYDLKPKDYKTA